MRYFDNPEVDLEPLKHVVLALPGSGAHYFSHFLTRRGRPCGHETILYDFNRHKFGLTRPKPTGIPNVEVNHILTSTEAYKIPPLSDKEHWVLVRDPLCVSLSLMVHNGSSFDAAIRSVISFHEKMVREGYKDKRIFIDQPTTWLEFDSTDHTMDILANHHNGGLFKISKPRLQELARKQGGTFQKLLDLRVRLGYDPNVSKAYAGS